MLKKNCHPKLIGFMIVVFVIILSIPTNSTAQIKTVKSLYERLGGYDAIAAVVDDFIGRLLNDAQLGKFFMGHSDDSKKRIRQLIVQQLCEATGGPCVYTGRDMKTSHDGLGITEEQWNVSVNHLIATLDKFKVPEKEKNEVIGAIAGLKKDTVQKQMTMK